MRGNEEEERKERKEREVPKIVKEKGKGSVGRGMRRRVGMKEKVALTMRKENGNDMMRRVRERVRKSSNSLPISN